MIEFNRGVKKLITIARIFIYKGFFVTEIINKYSSKENQINPLIGSAGVSAVSMAARVSNKEGLKSDSHNFLLMYAMGPNVSGVIGSAVAAGVLIAIFS
jgi:oxaloacetate decarboxylase beta subunit